ncbi:hypothetical protein [Streptomyces resistomycificus]|uniref:Uncharacterized protein n=1 Tax=Streptomyces resistomycificus TaxID=67356 RepID=A0A0L8L0J3_9ACTN|nr:hypothetical protein [Streptomyces resistomycificus]KOG31621.1 hypothetical protein ADK37_30000 [Streptomyces resistomycificus]KUN97078.1 hypothetical protein AQJ84_17705 [Streptomyces resistomycificus]
MPDRETRKDPSPRAQPGTPYTARRAGPNTPGASDPPETDAERRRRRAQFLRDLAEARELRDRVQPRRAKTARLRHAMRMRTFRW